MHLSARVLSFFPQDARAAAARADGLVVEAAEPVAEAKTEEAAVEQRRKRSPVYVVPVPQVHQYPASTYPLLYSKPDVAAKTEETAEAKSEPEPDTKALLEEQPNPVAPVTQIKPVFNLQPYYSGVGWNELSWGPIMGLAYGKSWSRFSRGEYPNANNFEDDIAIITSKLSQR